MAFFKIKTGVEFVADMDKNLFVMDETGHKIVTSELISKLVLQIQSGVGDEEEIVAALQDSFPLNYVYYTLIQLEEQGIIEHVETKSSPADLFHVKVYKEEQIGYPLSKASVVNLGVIIIGGANIVADTLAKSLERSSTLNVKKINDWKACTSGNVYMVVTSDYLEPEVERFGHFAHKAGICWFLVKPSGVIPWIGPLFKANVTGCIECLLDRVKGHRRLESDLMRKKGEYKSLRLSVGYTAHSLEVVSGLLATEIQKLAGEGTTEMVGRVFTLDFRTMSLTGHKLTRRPQCTLCGITSQPNDIVIPNEPFCLQSSAKTRYSDGGERICTAAETLERYAHIVSPITGIVGTLKELDGIPRCFGTVTKSSWIVRSNKNIQSNNFNGRLSVIGVGTGKGMSKQQGLASALGEAVERYCSQYEGYEPCIRASFNELTGIAIHPNDLMGFSKQQYENREVWRKKGATAYVPDPYDTSRPIDWTPAWSLTKKQWRLVPSAYVFYSYLQKGGGDICNGCSNGVAAGNSLEEAVMQGFYELVERDATAMWWYHKLLKPAVDWQNLKSPFTTNVEDDMNRVGMRLEILDLTNDLGIPVFSANLFDCNRADCLKSIGLGCHQDPHIALERAVSELGQTWRMTEQNSYSIEMQKFLNIHEPFFSADSSLAPKRLSDFTIKQNNDFLDDIEDAVHLLQDRGLEMIIVDLTRPDIGFPVVRVIVPGMIHFWPRFGCRRLLEVPKMLGWIDRDISEDNLNPVPFFL